MTKLFYYDKDYPMEVSESAKNLLLARDAYLKAWWEWNDMCLRQCDPVRDELDTLRGCMEKIIEREKENNTEMLKANGVTAPC